MEYHNLQVCGVGNTQLIPEHLKFSSAINQVSLELFNSSTVTGGQNSFVF